MAENEDVVGTCNEEEKSRRGQVSSSISEFSLLENTTGNIYHLKRQLS